MFILAVALLGLFAAAPNATAADKRESSIEFRADSYTRDNRTNSIVGKGNAWARKNDKEIHADEMYVDFNTDQAIAIGHVRITDGPLNVWCEQANFGLSNDEATFTNATVTTGQTVITGTSIVKLDANTLEVDNGTYTTCNVDEAPPQQAANCPLDWRISGSRFRIEIGNYAHLYDVLVQTKSVPIFYLPYIVFPMKSGRQTGVLPLVVTNASNLGTGISVPIFFALNEWSDLLATYTHFSVTGMHLAFNYRYIYSPASRGTAGLYLLGQDFGPDDNPEQAPQRGKTLGLFGEAAVSINNVYTFQDNRSYSRQMLNLVSNPYYSFNYLANLHPRANLGYLRNQFSLANPRDSWFWAGQVQYYQPLVISDDSGVDGGAVFQLPTVIGAKANSSLVDKYLDYEFDAEFTNYHRKVAYDEVPAVPLLSGNQADNIVGFDGNDYVRTGRRLQLEPRLVLNTPMPYGFMLQPVLKAGTLLYHFSTPRSQAISKYYLQTEIPFSFQVQKSFSTGIEGYERLQHVFQPRVIFASDLYSNPTASHPFFQRTSADISNPPFDEMDLLPHFQYFRFELINRFRVKSGPSWNRFFLLQMSEQLNTRTDATDPRFREKFGPIELLGSLNMGYFSWNVQALYPLTLTRTLNGGTLHEPVRQVTLSSGLGYNKPQSDLINLNVTMYKNADPALTSHNLAISWYKYLPLFFDVEASVEYNLLKGFIRSYGAGFHFRRKPRSCWHFSLNLSRNIYGQTFTQFGFGFDFGSH